MSRFYVSKYLDTFRKEAETGGMQPLGLSIGRSTKHTRGGGNCCRKNCGKSMTPCPTRS